MDVKLFYFSNAAQNVSSCLSDISGRLHGSRSHIVCFSTNIFASAEKCRRDRHSWYRRRLWRHEQQNIQPHHNGRTVSGNRRDLRNFATKKTALAQLFRQSISQTTRLPRPLYEQPERASALVFKGECRDSYVAAPSTRVGPFSSCRSGDPLCSQCLCDSVVN